MSAYGLPERVFKHRMNMSVERRPNLLTASSNKLQLQTKP